MDPRLLCEEIRLPAPTADVFAAFANRRNPVFLDSSLAHPHLGRFSYIAADPLLALSSQNGRIAVDFTDFSGQVGETFRSMALSAVEQAAGDPFLALQRLVRMFQRERAGGLPSFQGGLLGYFAYDLAQHIEELPRLAVDDVGLPDLHVGLYPWVLAHDHFQNRSWLIVNRLAADGRAAELLMASLRRTVDSVRRRRAGDPMPRPAVKLNTNFTREEYLETVRAAKERIAAGDIYEVCLSQRFALEVAEHPWQLYLRLRSVSPVPYGAYLGLKEGAVLSGSPEMFLRLEAGRVETRPIKGTRPRGRRPELDKALAEELRASEKEQAENLMIVDLLRNDLGKVCEIGSVVVPELFVIESYSTVHQMVSTVRGTLRPELNALDLLRASFPGGSVTGCPKIRAMEIIDELEPTRRGIYCGAIGFVDFGGDMDTSIVIRTIVVKGDRAYLQVGGAIVADSDPEAEYQETLDKAQAALLAISGERLGTEVLARH